MSDQFSLLTDPKAPTGGQIVRHAMMKSLMDVVKYDDLTPFKSNVDPSTPINYKVPMVTVNEDVSEKRVETVRSRASSYDSARLTPNSKNSTRRRSTLSSRQKVPVEHPDTAGGLTSESGEGAERCFVLLSVSALFLTPFPPFFGRSF